MSVCCDATLLREGEYAWHLLARIKEPIFEWPGCDKCKHVMIFNPGKNVIIRVLHWYRLSTNQMPGFLLSANQGPDTWYPGPRAGDVCDCTVASSHIAGVSHSDSTFRYYLCTAQWSGVTNNNRSFVIRLIWGIWCDTGDHWPPSCWGEGGRIKFGWTKTTEITSGHISPKTSSDWVFVMINASVSSVLRWDLAISAQIQHKTIHCSGHLSSQCHIVWNQRNELRREEGGFLTLWTVFWLSAFRALETNGLGTLEMLTIAWLLTNPPTNLP